MNRVATAVQLRFDAARSPGIPAPVLERLRRIAGKRMTSDGVLILQSDRFRSQERNRRDVLERFEALLREASRAPRKRIPTRPGKASAERVRAAKRRRSRVKALRRPVDPGGE